MEQSYQWNPEKVFRLIWDSLTVFTYIPQLMFVPGLELGTILSKRNLVIDSG